MIGKLKGVVDAVGADELILDVNGVGYLVACGARVLARLTPGETTTVHVETHVREDAFKLYGFLTEDERAWFVRLQAIQGVGAKVALAVLDIMTPGELMAAASNEDKAAVSRAQGVGPRLAQRIVTELKDKPAPSTRFGQPARAAAAPVVASAGGAPVAANGSGVGEAGLALRADAVSALVNLGLDESAARAAVAAAQGAVAEDEGLDALIKAALKEMGR